MSVGNYLYAGINEVEAQSRVDQYHSGVPAQGGGLALLEAPSGAGARQGLAQVEVQNVGATRAHLRLRHGGGVKSVAGEQLAALLVGGSHYGGRVQYRNLVAGSLRISEAGVQVIVDDGNGVLYDDGTTTPVRGTVNYASGIVDFTFGAAPTKPVVVAYDHEDFVDFASGLQTEIVAVAAFPVTFNLGWGRVNPGSLALTDTGPRTFVDDGKGRILETTVPAATAVAGSIDYATGTVTLTTGTVGNFTITYTFNPFAGLAAPGGGTKLLDLFPGQLPELTVQPWAIGINGETKIALWGECVSAGESVVITRWTHFGEDPFRVNALYSGFLPGGESNNPALS